MSFTGFNKEASFKISVMSSCSSPPSLSKNLIPFLLKGRWLAVIIAEPWNAVSAKTIDINIAGVVAIPQSTTFAPALTIPAINPSAKAEPETLESRPTPIVNAVASQSSFFANQLT